MHYVIAPPIAASISVVGGANFVHLCTVFLLADISTCPSCTFKYLHNYVSGKRTA